MDNNSESMVTVIMCTYRRPRLLKRAINSVLNQTYPHLKICIYDDASGDETPEVVAEFAKKDARVVYQCHEKNIGAVKNLRYGSERVDTSFFAILPDDDVFLPRHLEFAMEGFKQNPEAIFSANQSISINSSGMIHKVTLHEGCRNGLYKPPEGLMFLLSIDPCILQGAVFRREVNEEIGFYDPEVAHISDWDYVFRIAAQCPFVINKKPGALFFVNPEGFSSSVLNKFYWPEWLKMYRKLMDHPLLDADTKKAVEFHLKNRLRSLLVNQGKQAILVKDYLTAGSAAETLKDFFKSNRLYLKLTILGKLCKYFPPLRWYLKLYGSLRNVKKSFKKRHRFPEYQQYATFLKN